MELGDYSTNVLCNNNFATINYEYLEVHPNQQSNSRRQLHELEEACKREGRLAYHDLHRNGIWLFTPLDNLEQSSAITSLINIAESLGIRLVEKERGVYETSSSSKDKQAHSSTLSTTGSAHLASVSHEGVRNAQATGLRTIQQNVASGLSHERPLLSPNIRVLAEPQTPQKNIHEHVLSAVLRTIVYQLCRKSGFLPLDSRTLILPSSRISEKDSYISRISSDATEVMVATLYVNLTPLGSLIVKARSDFTAHLKAFPTHRFGNSDVDCMLGQSLWLVPGGFAAYYQGIILEKSSKRLAADDAPLGSGSSPHRPDISADDLDHWKTECVNWMIQQGLNLSQVDMSTWLYVQAHRSDVPYTKLTASLGTSTENSCVIPWPASLCFLHLPWRTSHTTQHEILPQWSQDPLYFAESWFAGDGERNGALNKRQKDRQALEATSRENAEEERRIAQFPASSPIALRRGSNAGAMYPTPPDALQHPFGATPSFDGNGSTPGNANSYQQHDGGVTSTSQPAVNLETELWTSSTGKKHQHIASDVPNDDDDDLFGEADGDLFGTDVTDADFSFFDQPDDNPYQDKVNALVDQNLQTTDSLDVDMDFGEVKSSTDADIEMELAEKEASLEETKGLVPTSKRNESPGEDKNTVTTLENRRRSLSVEGRLHPPEESPPFDRDVVFDRLFHESMRDKPIHQPEKSLSFNKMHFKETLATVDGKYHENGQFGFIAQKGQRNTQKIESLRLPRTDYLKHKELLSRKIDHRHKTGPVLSLLGKSSEQMDYSEDSDRSSQSSDQDDLEDVGARLHDCKNNASQDVSQDPFSPVVNNRASVEPEHFSHTPRSVGDPFSTEDTEANDRLLAAYLLSPLPDSSTVSLSDNERIAAAQILADQAVSGILRLPGSTVESLYDSTQRSHKTKSLRSLIQVMGECLTEFTNCTVRAYLDIPGLPVIQGVRIPPRPTGLPRALSMLDFTKTGNPFIIHGPRLELKRADSKLSVLPSAVDFWDNLGLGPSSGSKDIVAVCVYPNSEGVTLMSNMFLDQMRSLYETLRLGAHDRLVTKELTHALLPYAVDLGVQDDTRFVAVLKETFGRLGRVFTSQSLEEKNLVVYFVYPPDDGRFLVHVCSAFQHLFTIYRRALMEKKMNAVNELVLQLVPLDFISSPRSLVVRSSNDYSRLALEVYDRCVDFTSLSSSPAILLEQPLPKVLDFKLSAQPSAALLQENTCLHIAYAQSLDNRWVTAAWTDNKGAQQMTASYCLGRKHEPISLPFDDIAQEIWATTVDYISSKKIHWRLIIVRVGVMDPSEVEIWTRLASTMSGSNLSLTLVAADAEPTLSLLPAPITLIPNTAPVQPVLTPASTPQPTQTTFSQDNASTPTKEPNNPSTPGETTGEPEKDAYLVDCTDQTWGAVLSHRLSNSNSTLETNLALISGYLIKRGGTSPEDPPTLLEVSIIHSDIVGNPRTYYESLLREILGYYRGLGTLARVRGIVDPVVDCRPWHIAVVEKAIKALYLLL